MWDLPRSMADLSRTMTSFGMRQATNLMASPQPQGMRRAMEEMQAMAGGLARGQMPGSCGGDAPSSDTGWTPSGGAGEHAENRGPWAAGGAAPWMAMPQRMMDSALGMFRQSCDSMPNPCPFTQEASSADAGDGGCSSC